MSAESPRDGAGGNAGAAVEHSPATSAGASQGDSSLVLAEGSGDTAPLGDKVEQTPEAVDSGAKDGPKDNAVAVIDSMPKLDAALKGALSYDEKESWFRRLSNLPITETQLVELVEDKPDTAETSLALPQARRQLTIARHAISRWWHEGSPIARTAYLAGWLTLLIGAAIKWSSPFYSLLVVAGILIAKTSFVVRDMRPKNKQIIQRGFTERKLALAKLLHTAQQWYKNPPSDRELQEFRNDALALAANYVRDHRSRYGSKTIVANLLVRDGADGVRVIGRSDPGRPLQRYAADERKLVWEVLETGNPKLTGDVYADFPTPRTDRKYCSILVLPVWFQGHVVAAVSIDSEDKWHFHIDYVDLQTNLAPYVQLIAASLAAVHDRPVVPS